MGARCETALAGAAPGMSRPAAPSRPMPAVRPATEPGLASSAYPLPGTAVGPGMATAGAATSPGAGLRAALTVSARNVPADAVSGASGDVCAAQRTPYGLRLLIGDVRGKGPRAAVGAAALRRAFDRAADRVPTLSVLVDTLEWALVGATAQPAHRGGKDSGPHNGARLGGARPGGASLDAGATGADEDSADENFATVLVAEVSLDGRTLRLVNRGHPAPLLLRPGRMQRLEPRRRLLPLGLGAVAGIGQVSAPAGPYADELAFPEGASLLLFTDGVTEARNAQGVFYDPLARLTRFAGAAPADLIDVLHRDVIRHTGSAPADDMAMLAVRRAARAPGQPTPGYGRAKRRPNSGCASPFAKDA